MFMRWVLITESSQQAGIEALYHQLHPYSTWSLSLKRTLQDGYYLLIICSALFLLLGLGVSRVDFMSVPDFQGVYFGVKALLAHHDPYVDRNVVEVFHQRLSADQVKDLGGVAPPFASKQVYPPTTLLLFVPFALLSVAEAQQLWMVILAVSVVIAAFAVMHLAAQSASTLSGVLVGFTVATSLSLVMTGNLAALSVSLCLIAAWSWIEGKFIREGVLCCALSLAIKPQDAGFVWLFFLLSGGHYTKRSLQAFALVAVCSLVALAWIFPVAPNWISESATNLKSMMQRGGVNDPGPSGQTSHSTGMVIDLQAAISYIRDEPRLYDTVTYAVCGTLITLWAIAALRSRPSRRLIFLGLAAIAPLTLLITYHRLYDAKILLLAVPACAELWSEHGRHAWPSLVITSLAIVFTSDIPLYCLVWLDKHFLPGSIESGGSVLGLFVERPTPILLLLMALYYQCLYLGHVFGRESHLFLGTACAVKEPADGPNASH